MKSDDIITSHPQTPCPLKARYCGPYTAQENCNDVDYIISTPDRRKSRRLCQINLLKHHHNWDDKPAALVTLVQEKKVREQDISEEDRWLRNSDVLKNIDQKLGHLLDPERIQVKSLLIELVVSFLMLQKK